MSGPAPRLIEALRDRYTLERELGRGGMATVYLAHDLRHDRPLALKVMHPELAATLGPERFLREIRLAARLQHPHILSVIDSGESAGLLWFTMPFVDGESLRDRLRREKQLSVEESLRIAREAAQALHYAHTHGVIHRDVKPENILLLAGDGSTLVADFGVARALLGSEDALTETGLAVGTPAYMSPEQASGTRDLDARTDVYALATVLYEMLVGEPPFTGPTPQVALARRFTEAPRGLRQVRETVPEPVEQAVLKALARAPADRFATAADFARALAEPGLATSATATTLSPGAAPPASLPSSSRRRGPLAAALGVGFLLGLGVLFGWLRSRGGVGESPSGVQRVAVLPFDNLGDSADDYFADGVADEVRGKLAALPGVEVIARASSAQYRQTSKPPQQVARELRVRYLLTGTVRWEKQPGAGGRVRVSPELVDAARGTTRWQQPFDAPVADVFAVQADIAGRVAHALGVALGTGQRERLARRPTGNLDAYQHYLRGRELAGGENTTDKLRAAAAEFRAAVELDSSFAEAWAALGQTHAALFRLGGLQASDTRLAREAVERARAQAPESPETRLAAASYASMVSGDVEATLRELRAGLEVAPGRADLLAAAGSVELELGRVEEGLADMEHAARLDPRAPGVLRSLAGAYLGLHRLADAEGAIARARALNPASLSLGYQQALILVAKGDLEGARRVLSTMEQSQGARRVVAYVALRENLITVLDSTRLRLLLALTPADLDNGRADWALALAEGHSLLGNGPAARAYGDTAAAEYVSQTRELGRNMSPGDRAMQVGLRALSLAYAGRRAEATAEAQRAADDSAADAYVHHLAARAYLIAGQTEQALHQLELIAGGRLPGFYTRAWLRMDPAFGVLESEARFQQLVRGP